MTISAGLGAITAVDDLLAEIRQDDIIRAGDFDIWLIQGECVGVIGWPNAGDAVITR
jgi:hypothetical protein